jgi:hypothetical protein
LGITWGGLVGGRGHRKGQLRVLVLGARQPFRFRAPYCRRTKGKGKGKGRLS